jgi:hypothetical protein
MAFNLNSFGQVSVLPEYVTLQSGVVSGSPSFYSYISAQDTQATIATANYFAGVVTTLDLGDLIYAIDSTNVPQTYYVNAINKTAKTVTIATDAAADGFVVGPAVSTNNAIATYSGTTGQIIQNSVGILDGSGNVSGLLTVTNGVGAIGLPSYTFTGRTTNGLWSSAANTLDFSTNALRAFQITAAPALSVNWIAAAPSATTVAPTLSALGTDTNIDFEVVPKGTGGLAVAGATNAGSIKLWNQANTFFSQIQSAAVASSLTWTWALTDGAAGQVLSTNGSGTLSFVNSSKGTWIAQAATPATVAVNTNYVANFATLLTFNIPAAAAVGDTIQIVGLGVGGWLVRMNTGQTCNFDSTATSSAGLLSSTGRYDSVTIVCVVANTTFNVTTSIGNITVA